MGRDCEYCDRPATGGVMGPTILHPQIHCCGDHGRLAAYDLLTGQRSDPGDPPDEFKQIFPEMYDTPEGG